MEREGPAAPEGATRAIAGTRKIQRMCASRLRQRPTTRRLHHVRWLLAVSTRELRNVSNPVARGPLPQPKDRSTGQATRTSRRTRALLSEGRVTSHSARTGDVATTTGAARPRLPSASSPPPVPARRCCPTVLPDGAARRCTADDARPTVHGHSPADRESVAECGANRDRRGKSFQDDAAFGLMALAAPRLARPGPKGLPSAPARQIAAPCPAHPCPQIVASTTSRHRPLVKTPRGDPACPWPGRAQGLEVSRAFARFHRTTTENPEHAVCRAGARTQRAGSTPPARPPHGSNTQPAEEGLHASSMLAE
jgi:hypothetical protein